MLAVLYTRAQNGLDSELVRVEVHISMGLPAFNIVGMPETAVRESKDRVRAAIINSGFEFPTRKITVNLSPADLPKEGGRYDLPIAIGVLIASGQLACQDLLDYEFIGELSLTGELSHIKGVLPTVLSMPDTQTMIIPKACEREIAFLEKSSVLVAKSLIDVVNFLSKTHSLERASYVEQMVQLKYADFSEVKGQFFAKRALKIAAAGGHNVLLIGPPGTGKTMLASRLISILPKMTQAEAIESAKIASVSNQGFDVDYFGIRPFRSPHHTASSAALVGGGSRPKPGEISLAHNGVLFLDELPEFNRKVLETLREPLESSRINISRANQQLSFPADFQLVAAMNPCPCGYLGDKDKKCSCSADVIKRYYQKISGPFLDRVDIHVEVPRLRLQELQNKSEEESSVDILKLIEEVREIQIVRAGKSNAKLTPKEIEIHCVLDESSMLLLDKAQQRLNLSPRSLHRILKVARTIADLEKMPLIKASHLTEALAFRALF